MLLVAVVMMLGLTNCKKDLKESTPVSTQYVDAIDASFIPQDINVSVAKSLPFDAPVAANRTWSMYAKNSPFYSNAAFALINGSEFIHGSAAQIWWSTNPNPVSFPASQQVYSNLTPDENVRLVMETKDADSKVAYLGVVDFNPPYAQFPLTVIGKRLGDAVTLNTNALTSLPGAALTITATFDLRPINLADTKLGSLAGSSLEFSDIKYNDAIPTTVTVGSGDFVLYSGYDAKVFGRIDIKITQAASQSTPETTFHVYVDGLGTPGKSTKMTMSTTKVGWYDSSTANMGDINIDVNEVSINLNNL